MKKLGKISGEMIYNEYGFNTIKINISVLMHKKKASRSIFFGSDNQKENLQKLLCDGSYKLGCINGLDIVN